MEVVSSRVENRNWPQLKTAYIGCICVWRLYTVGNYAQYCFENKLHSRSFHYPTMDAQVIAENAPSARGWCIQSCLLGS